MPTNTRLLVVDDDSRLIRTLSRLLTSEGYNVETALSYAQASEILDGKKIDLILLDAVLPDSIDNSPLMEIRHKLDVPIIMLTGKDDRIDKVIGLEMGADDYITKPYDDRELLARIKAVLRRYTPQSDQQTNNTNELTILTFGKWTFSPSSHELREDSGRVVTLTTYETRLLEALVKSSPRVISREFIMDTIAGRESMPFDRSVDVLIAKLRKKIEPVSSHPMHIVTVRGAGYRFIPDVGH